MTSITKLAVVAAFVATLAAPVSALAYYPYTSFTGQNYFMGGGNLNVQQPNYYGSSNCNAYYGCGNIGYNAITGQGYGDWAGGDTLGYGTNYGSTYGGYGGYSGYGQQSIGGCYSCGVSQYSNSYMQYIPANVRQYVGGGYGGYNGGYGGYVY